MAVWLAREPGVRDRGASDDDGAIAVHAAAFDSGRGQRAIQATLVRVAPPLVAEGAAAEHLQLLSWRIVR